MESGLPPKKEYILYAPLTEVQKGIYEAVLGGTLRERLLEGAMGKGGGKDVVKGKGKKVDVDVDAPRGSRKSTKGRKVDYDVDGDDDDYLARLEAGEVEDYRETRRKSGKSAEELGREYVKKSSGEFGLSFVIHHSRY